METRLTALLNIDLPIVLPGMSWISTPELVAAVSNAGGLGILALGPLTPEQSRAAIRRVRELTDRAFGVNCALLLPGARDNALVALDEQVPVLNLSLGKAPDLVQACHAYGGKVIVTVTSEAHARSAEGMGADALLVTGHEAAAHGGAVTSLVLVPAIARAVDLPVIAAGGFADGQGLMAALALGADGVAMGSRLATCQESPLHGRVKRAVTEKGVQDTLYSPHFDGMPARYMATPLARKLTRKPMPLSLTLLHAVAAARQLGLPLWQVVMGVMARLGQVKQLAYFGAATPRLKTATEQGDLDKGMQFIGQTQGLIKDTPAVAELLQRIMAEAQAVQQRWQARP